jgi:hypothetical protein
MHSVFAAQTLVILLGFRQRKGGTKPDGILVDSTATYILNIQVTSFTMLLVFVIDTQHKGIRSEDITLLLAELALQGATKLGFGPKLGCNRDM